MQIVCINMVQLLPLHPKTSPSLASFKSRLVLPFWYWLTQVVLEKRTLNRCSSNSSSFLLLKNTHGAVFDNNAVRQCGNTLVNYLAMAHAPHTHPFNGPLSGTTRVGQYQKDKTNLDFTEARDSEWQ